MKKGFYLSVFLLMLAIAPIKGLAASCDPDGGQSQIGTELVALSGPSLGEYYYDYSSIKCQNGSVVRDLSYMQYWDSPADILDQHLQSASTYRVFANSCGTRFIQVHKNYRGSMDGISLGLDDFSIAADAVYDDEFEQPLVTPFGPVIGNCLQPEDEPPPIDPSLGESGCEAGSPAAVTSGNNYQQETDYHHDSLSFDRSYNSQSERSGSLGPAWQHGFEQSLYVRDQEIVALGAGGGVISFSPVGSDWRSEHDPGSSLEAIATPVSGYLLRAASGVNEFFDRDGRWLASEDPGRYKLTASYAADRLESVSDQHGNRLLFRYDKDRLDTVTLPGGGEITYRYSSEGMLASVSTAGDAERLYHYQDPRHPEALTGITDENGDRFATWSYDAEGRVEQLFRGLDNDNGSHTDEAANFSFAYGEDRTTVTNPQGKDTVYHFTDFAGSKKVVRLEGVASSNCIAANRDYSYYPDGLLKSKTDWSGSTTTYTYNDRGLELSRFEAQGTPVERRITTEWHPILNKPVTLVEPGRITHFVYNAAGLLESKSISDTSAYASPARIWRYSYRDDGLLLTIDGPRSDVSDLWAFDYDSSRRLNLIRNPLGHEVTVTAHTPSGLPKSIIDANQIVTQLDYSPRGQLLSSSVAGLTTSYVYDQLGQILSVTLPGGARTSFEYDEAHRLRAIVNALGERIEYTLDAAGNRVAQLIKDADGMVVYRESRAFDALNRLVADIDALGAVTMRYQYDEQGNQTSQVEPMGASLIRIFDALNRVQRITHRDFGVSHYHYDGMGYLDQAIDQRGLTTEYGYDGLGNLRRLSSPDTGVTTFSYDTAGNLITRVDARQRRTEFSYDALGRLLQEQHPGDPWLDVDYVYDRGEFAGHGVGRLARIEDSTGSTSFSYDAVGRIISKTTRLGSQVYDWKFSYLNQDRPASVISASGLEVAYHYGDHGQLVSASLKETPSSPWINLVDSITHYPFGPVQSWHAGNGIQNNRSRDWNYRLEDIAAEGADTVLHRTQEYNVLQDILQIDDIVNAELSQSFDYDAEHRLARATGQYGTISYEYDTVGNRLGRMLAGPADAISETYHYGSGNNRVDSVSTDIDGSSTQQNFAYDATGNLIDGHTLSLSYSEANRPAIVTATTHSQAISHNAFGQRVTIAEGQEFRHYHYDSNGRLIAESDGSNGRIHREYIYVADLLVAVVDHSNADVDEDGLDDLWETEHFGGLDQDGSGDADGDYLTDALEYSLGSDPNTVEDSGLGDNKILDRWENHYFGMVDIDSAVDTDGDGVINLDEYRQLTDPTDALDFVHPMDWLFPVLLGRSFD